MKERINRVKLHLEGLGYNICFISIFGSQNYNLDIYTDEYTSDYDFKAVCLPSLRNLIEQTKPVSTSLEFEGGLIDIKDIRLFTEGLCKANPVNIETTYSDYTWQIEEFKEIIELGKQLPFDLTPLFVKGAYGQALEKVKAFSHPYPSTADKIEKFGYEPKQLTHIIRLYDISSMLVLFNKVQFKYTTNGICMNSLLHIKKGGKTLEEAIIMRDYYMEEFAKIREESNSRGMKFENKNKIIELSKNIIENFIIKEIKGI